MKKDNKALPRSLPCAAGLKKMCELYSNPEYIQQIGNRLFVEVCKNEYSASSILCNRKNPDDLYLTFKAICIFREILEGYFSPDFLDDLAELLYCKDAEFRYRGQLQRLLNEMSVYQLNDAILELDSLIRENGPKPEYTSALQHVKTELLIRKNPLNRLIRLASFS